jgi:hypothetical protein
MTARLLQAASVIGRQFEPELLAAVVGETDIDARLAPMLGIDLVYQESEVSLLCVQARSGVRRTVSTPAYRGAHPVTFKDRGRNRTLRDKEVSNLTVRGARSAA